MILYEYSFKFEDLRKGKIYERKIEVEDRGNSYRAIGHHHFADYCSFILKEAIGSVLDDRSSCSILLTSPNMEKAKKSFSDHLQERINEKEKEILKRQTELDILIKEKEFFTH